MEAKNLSDFVKIMRAISRVFTDFEPDTLLVDLYFEILKKYSIESIREAAEELLKTRERSGMPKPAEFINCIDRSKSKALIAWMKIEAVSYQRMQTNDDIADKIWAGMYSRWAASTETEVTWLQKEFERRYMAMYDNPADFPELAQPKVQALLPDLLKHIDETTKPGDGS